MAKSHNETPFKDDVPDIAAPDVKDLWNKMCKCGHYAQQHYWYAPDRKHTGCSWCDCKEFQPTSICPCCGQDIVS
jgi:hypothetical protein